MTINAFITPQEHPVAVHTNDGLYGYECLNLKGNQVCFPGWLYEDPEHARVWHNNDCNPFGHYLREHFPVSLFFGKKEGDTVDLIFLDNEKKEITVSAKLTGVNGRKFEDMLFERTTGFGGVFDPTDKDDLSKIKQYCLVVATHQQYAESIGMKAENPENFRYSSYWIKCLKEESAKKPKLTYFEKISQAMSNDPDLTPVERLGGAMLKVKLSEE